MTLDEEKAYVKELTLFWKSKWQELHNNQTVTITRDEMIKLHDTATHLHAFSLLLAATEMEEAVRNPEPALTAQIIALLTDVMPLTEGSILKSRITHILGKINRDPLP